MNDKGPSKVMSSQHSQILERASPSVVNNVNMRGILHEFVPICSGFADIAIYSCLCIQDKMSRAFMI